MSALSKETQRRLTEQWSRELPGFDVWRPLRLLRRIGSVLQGVTLDRSNAGDCYFATSHVHGLTREFPVISLSMAHRLREPSGQPMRIPVSAEDISLLAANLIDQTAHSLRAEPPSLAEIISTYHKFALDQYEKGYPPAFMELEDSIFAASLAGEPTLVDAGLRISRQLAYLWPPDRLPLEWQGADVWLDGLQSRAADVDHLASIVQNEIKIHRLAKIRFSE